MVYFFEIILGKIAEWSQKAEIFFYNVQAQNYNKREHKEMLKDKDYRESRDRIEKQINDEMIDVILRG